MEKHGVTSGEDDVTSVQCNADADKRVVDSGKHSVESVIHDVIAAQRSVGSVANGVIVGNDDVPSM